MDSQSFLSIPTVLLLLVNLGRFAAAQQPLAFDDPQPQRYEISARASQIDSRAKEHPEIDFVFTNSPLLKQHNPDPNHTRTIDLDFSGLRAKP